MHDIEQKKARPGAGRGHAMIGRQLKGLQKMRADKTAFHDFYRNPGTKDGRAGKCASTANANASPNSSRCTSATLMAAPASVAPALRYRETDKVNGKYTRGRKSRSSSSGSVGHFGS